MIATFKAVFQKKPFGLDLGTVQNVDDGIQEDRTCQI